MSFAGNFSRLLATLIVMGTSDDDKQAPGPSGNPIYVYDPRLRDELRKSLPHLDIREPDGTEPDLHFVWVDAVQQISLPYDRNGTGNIDPELVRQVGPVRFSYDDLVAIMGYDVVLSHIAGINARLDIIYRRLDEGVIVGAYQAGEYTGALTGSYVTPDIGATTDDLGIPPQWAAEKTHFALFEVIEWHFVLETTAAPFGGAGGGARQYFLEELAYRRRYRPVDFSRAGHIRFHSKS
jgi:hypothetical protein